MIPTAFRFVSGLEKDATDFQAFEKLWCFGSWSVRFACPLFRV